MTCIELDDLIEKYINGDSSVFENIYYETQKSVYLSIRMIITNQYVIEDLMQDTYMTALDNLDKYNLGTNFKAWISRIARNKAINHYNKEKRLEVFDIDNPVFQEEDKQSKLSLYLSYLDGIEREIVIYHLVLSLKYKEISKIMNIPLSSVHYLYKKGIKKIKELM